MSVAVVVHARGETMHSGKSFRSVDVQRDSEESEEDVSGANDADGSNSEENVHLSDQSRTGRANANARIRIGKTEIGNAALQ